MKPFSWSPYVGKRPCFGKSACFSSAAVAMDEDADMRSQKAEARRREAIDGDAQEYSVQCQTRKLIVSWRSDAQVGEELPRYWGSPHRGTPAAE
mmetsp:Transcript_50187/g.103286  ORF Transcript_50187/g.103286 Transcript_50187/m.103286 type:complete len:94 (-) Transcript_50187:30-311(-)